MAQNKKFSVIIPLYKKGYETLDRCFLNLREQDYKNFEVILVHNSPDEEGKKFLKSKKSPLKGFKYPVIEIDAGYIPELKNGNHCRAFNKGAEVATGDYLIFCDPDVYLLPGILREYKDAFEKEGVDFVYGDYDFEGGAGRITGRPYREYELRCANYISGCMPIKKEAFKGWDENLQSLQDWDMWLSAVEAGAKGFYIGRPCFTTDVPHKEGISANQAENWLERYSQIRSKHGFPVSNTAVTSLGAPHHATNTAEVLGVDTRVLANIVNFKPHTYENIYLLGFYPLAWQRHMSLFYQLGDFKGELAGKKRIIHWIGTDIFQMQHKVSWTTWKNMTNFLNDPEFGFIHLAECEATQKELEELGIPTEVVPLPTAIQHELVPLPEDFTVGVYVNPTQDMYFEEFMYQVADAMPDVQFKFFGNPNRKEVQDNKEWVGFVDMKEFLPTVSAIVRLTVHDGLPMGPIEAMQAGRNVLASVPLKHALHLEYVAGEPVKADVVAKIRELQEMPLNTEGSEYWRKEVSPELFKERMSKYLA